MKYRIPKLATMPAEAWEALDALCNSRGLSRGAVIEALVEAETHRERRRRSRMRVPGEVEERADVDR